MAQQKTDAARISLANVLCDESEPPYSLEEFSQFLKKEHSEENLEFWQSIVNYRQKALPHFPRSSARGSRGSMLESFPSNGSLGGSSHSLSAADRSGSNLDLDSSVKEELKADLEAIVTIYLTPGGRREVNLGELVRKKTVKDITEKKVLHPDVFKVAAEKIFELMRLDSFNRFIKKANDDSVKAGLPRFQIDREGGARSAMNALQKHCQNSGRTAAI